MKIIIKFASICVKKKRLRGWKYFIEAFMIIFLSGRILGNAAFSKYSSLKNCCSYTLHKRYNNTGIMLTWLKNKMMFDFKRWQSWWFKHTQNSRWWYRALPASSDVWTFRKRETKVVGCFVSLDQCSLNTETGGGSQPAMVRVAFRQVVTGPSEEVWIQLCALAPVSAFSVMEADVHAGGSSSAKSSVWTPAHPHQAALQAGALGPQGS